MRRVIAASLLVVLALAGCSSEPELTPVPSVIGLPGDEAEDLLEDAGFDVEWDAGEESVWMASNWSVDSQEPAADAGAEDGATVTLSVSKPEAVAPEATDAPDSPSAADPNCLPVAESVRADIEAGINNSPGTTITHTAAYVAGDRAEVWFIAGELAGTGIDPGSAIGLWAMNANPDGTGSGLTIAVDGFADQFTDWPYGPDTSFEITSFEPGAQEALACLK
jgi:hypothetical protein